MSGRASQRTPRASITLLGDCRAVRRVLGAPAWRLCVALSHGPRGSVCPLNRPASPAGGPASSPARAPMVLESGLISKMKSRRSTSTVRVSADELLTSRPRLLHHGPALALRPLAGCSELTSWLLSIAARSQALRPDARSRRSSPTTRRLQDRSLPIHGRQSPGSCLSQHALRTLDSR